MGLPQPTGKPPRGLRERELEIFRLIANGLSNAEIGQDLYISDTPVKTHVTHILQKLNLRDRVQAVVLAYQTGPSRRTHGGQAAATRARLAECPRAPRLQSPILACARSGVVMLDNTSWPTRSTNVCWTIGSTRRNRRRSGETHLQ